jgi:hypothetical protein
MSDYVAMHLAITDDTYIAWLVKNALYSKEREKQYSKWNSLCQEYKALEFAILLAATAASKSDTN